MAGEHYHHLMDGAPFLGEATTTTATVRLVDLGWYPALTRPGSTAVRGELYEVSPELLDRLDALEEHPDVYLRGPITLADGRRATTYWLDGAEGVTIDCGHWPTYRSQLATRRHAEGSVWPRKTNGR